MNETPRIRDATDADAAGLIELIGGVFAEYPGCVLDVDGELPELRAIATHFARLGGRFWVAEIDGQIVGCIGLSPATAPGGIELRKLYVRKDARRSGLGGTLCGLVEPEARRRGAAFVHLSSDTPFDKAHRLYERRGYVRGPSTRDLHDKSDSVEYHYELALTP